MSAESITQVLVVGAGNAGLCAAIAASQAGAQVAVLERAPREFRGGNSALTDWMRFPYDSVEDLIPLVPDISESEIRGLAERQPCYTQADFYDDIMRVTEGRSDPELAELLVRQAYPTIRWLRSLGHAWVPNYAGPSSSGSVQMNGGGAGLQERNFAIAEGLGIPIHYETRAWELLQDDQGRITGVRARAPGGFVTYRAPAVVLACGGFEGNAEMRARYLGPNWDIVKMRGVPFNTGDGLKMALDQVGALPYGSWSSCHASPQDLNRPQYSLPGLEKMGWNRYGYPFGIMVNLLGQRFVDEGEDLRRLTYAKMGRFIHAQPSQAAFQIFDAKAQMYKLLPAEYAHASGARAPTLEALAQQLGIDAAGLVRTVAAFNAAVQPGEFNPLIRDGKATIGILPPKSNWALPLDTPPFEGYPVCCGITFTFGGVRINAKAQVIHTLDRPIPGLYAAGEMVGGIWHWNYPSGGGMTAGAVFGKIAGTNAAQESRA